MIHRKLALWISLAAALYCGAIGLLEYLWESYGWASVLFSIGIANAILFLLVYKTSD